MTENHTATPFKAVTDENQRVYLRDENGGPVAQILQTSHAEFVERACNSHDDLTKNLRNVSDLLAAYVNNEIAEAQTADTSRASLRILQRARDALTKAQGE